MAYPETCWGALQAMKSSAAQSLLYSNRCLNHMSDAWSHWNSNQDHLAIEDILSGLSDTNAAAGYAGYGYSPFDYEGPWHWYFINCLTEYDLTLNDILAAMLTATPDQIEQFIGTVDAFRTSMWNRPFDTEYFALLAKQFAQWE